MLEKSLRLLQAFGPSGRPLRLADLTRRSGMPKSTTHRLAHELVALRLLELEDGYFRIGVAVFELGRLVPVTQRLRETAMPFMQDLFAATQETVHLGIRDGYDVIYAEKIHGHGGIHLPSRVGGRLPLTCTAVGKALLACSERALIDDVLSHPLRRITEFSVVDPAVLERQLAEIRATGLALEREEAGLGGACVAAPVLVAGQPVAALSVSVAVADYQPTRLAAAVRTAAFGLSRQLAH